MYMEFVKFVLSLLGGGKCCGGLFLEIMQNQGFYNWRKIELTLQIC